MIIFSTIGGTTRKVAQRVAQRIGDRTVIDARTAMAMLSPALASSSHLLLFCPTYGDAEVEDEFETLLLGHDWSACQGAGFAFCELGVYTGYEEFGHGLAKVVNQVMTRHDMHPLAPPLSIDSIPITDWNLIDAWADLIAAQIGH